MIIQTIQFRKLQDFTDPIHSNHVSPAHAASRLLSFPSSAMLKAFEFDLVHWTRAAKGAEWKGAVARKELSAETETPICNAGLIFQWTLRA